MGSVVDGPKSTSSSSSENSATYCANTLEYFDDLLTNNSYINGDEISMEDIRWFAAVSELRKKNYPSLNRWYNHVLFNLVACLPDDTQGVELVGSGATSFQNPDDDDMAKVRMVLDSAREGIVWEIIKQRIKDFGFEEQGFGQREYNMTYPIKGLGEKKPNTEQEWFLYQVLDFQAHTLKKLELMKQEIQQKQLQRDETFSQGSSSHQ